MGKKKKDKKAKKARRQDGTALPEPATPPPRAAPAMRKRMISFRVDPDVLDFFKAGGPGYQTRMHAVLRAHVDRARG